MVELSRIVRFCLNTDTGERPGRYNTFAAWPPMRGLGCFYQIRIRCQGEPDPITGYFMNIKEIDQATWEHALSYLARLLADELSSAEIPVGRVMQTMLERIQPALSHSVVEMRLDLTPYYSVIIRSLDMSSLLMSQQFEFAAAHRLHVPEFSDQKNREVFGKCNNPSGHGHNYRLEVVVRAPVDGAGHILPAEQLDQLVYESVLDKLDHKNLNVDVPQFAEVNSSVENIARVIYGMLNNPVREIGLELDQVSVWETSKTVCTYRE